MDSLIETRLAIFVWNENRYRVRANFAQTLRGPPHGCSALESASVTTTTRSAIVSVSYGLRRCTYLSLASDDHPHASRPEIRQPPRRQAQESNVASATARIVASRGSAMTLARAGGNRRQRGYWLTRFVLSVSAEVSESSFGRAFVVPPGYASAAKESR